MRAVAARVGELESEWVQAHRELSRLALERAAAESLEGRWLLAALRAAAHVHLGFSSFAEYVGRMFGYSPRSTQEKLRVAEALEELPALAQAFESGALHWSAARELTRVAVPETETEWLAVAHGKTLRQLEELVAGASPGDRPSTPRQPGARRRVLRFEVAPETFALVREALAELRRRSDTRLDDDALLLTLARNVLGEPREQGRSSYQVSLTVCCKCGRGAQIGNGELVAVGPEIVALAQCDGQELGHVAQAANDNPIPPDGAASETTENAPSGSRLVSTSAHGGAHDSAIRARARQSIPPALRRAVLARDQRSCRVPGCCNATFLDLHHLELRSEGGRHDAANLVTLCGAHHRAAHRGELIIEGNTAASVGFRHADGSGYGEPASPQALDVYVKVFSALRKLGFREAEVRNVVAQLRRHPAGPTLTPELLLRDALARLIPGCPKH